MKAGRTARAGLALGTAAVLGALSLPASASAAPTTTRISSDVTGAPAADHSSRPAISADGRYITYESRATTLVAADTNGHPDVFLHDRQTGTTELVSVSSAEVQADGESFAAGVSGNGRYVVFASQATNLVAGDTNDAMDIFVRDRRNGTTRRVSVSSSGAQANDHSQLPQISANGRYVVFSTAASNLVSGDTNGKRDVFLHDLSTGKTKRVSLSRSGRQGNGDSDPAGISADGCYVGFVTTSTNLGPLGSGESFGYVKNISTAVVELASVAPSGVQFVDGALEMSLSADGRRVAFDATPTTASGMTQIYSRDLRAKTTTLVTVNVSGQQSSGTASHGSISANGRYVGFVSGAHDLPGGFQFTNGVFVRDLTAAATIKTSVTTAGDPVNTWSGVGGIANVGITFTTAASYVTPDGASVTTSQVYLRTF